MSSGHVDITFCLYLRTSKLIHFVSLKHQEELIHSYSLKKIFILFLSFFPSCHNISSSFLFSLSNFHFELFGLLRLPLETRASLFTLTTFNKMAPYIHLSYKTFFSVSLSKKRKKGHSGLKGGKERRRECGTVISRE